MRNSTNCVVVWRVYEILGQDNAVKTIRTKDYLFRDDVSCRRYCVHAGGKMSFITDTTEHPPGFFDSVVNAEYGSALYRLYISENIDPVPIGDHITYENKYSCIKELWVCFNVLFDENIITNALYKSRTTSSKLAFLSRDAYV